MGKLKDIAGEKARSYKIMESAYREDAPKTNECAVQLIKDAETATLWLAEDSNRSLLGQNWVDFAYSKGWTRGYRHEIASIVRDELVHRCHETVEQARARIVSQCDETRRSAMLMGEHGPAIAALRLQSDILLPKQAEKHLHLHAHRDLSAMSDDELSKIASLDVLKADDDHQP